MERENLEMLFGHTISVESAISAQLVEIFEVFEEDSPENVHSVSSVASSVFVDDNAADADASGVETSEDLFKGVCFFDHCFFTLEDHGEDQEVWI